MGFAEDVKRAKADIEKTMVDTMDVVRHETYTDPVTREEKHRDVTICTNEPCFISYTTQNNDNPNTQAVDSNPINWKPLILCKLNVDVLAGDEVTVFCTLRDGTIFKGNASDIDPLLTHKEFNIGIRKEA